MFKCMSEDEYVAHQRAMAQELVADYELLESGDRRWVLGTRRISMVVELVSRSRVLIHGDHDALLLRHGVVGDDPFIVVQNLSHESAVGLSELVVDRECGCVMARSPAVAASYLIDMAYEAFEEDVCEYHHDAHDGTEGMTWDSIDMQWLTLLSWLARICFLHNDYVLDLVSASELLAFHGYSVADVIEFLEGRDIYPDDAGAIGEVVSPRVFGAQAILVKLKSLLVRTKEADRGT